MSTLDLTAMDLPPHVHATVLTDRDVVSGEDLAYPVLWCDRVYGVCPRCDEPVDREPDCPVLLNTGVGMGGEIEEISQEHGCGDWLPVTWAELPAGADAEAVEAAAEKMAAQFCLERDDERARIRVQLTKMLRKGLARLAEPLEDGETIEDRRSELGDDDDTEPGLFFDNGQLTAWDYDPDGSGDCIKVSESDLAAGSG